MEPRYMVLLGLPGHSTWQSQTLGELSADLVDIGEAGSLDAMAVGEQLIIQRVE